MMTIWAAARVTLPSFPALLPLERPSKVRQRLHQRETDVNCTSVSAPPCQIRGLQVRFIDVLNLFAAGLSSEQFLSQMLDLKTEDLKMALHYAPLRLDHPGVST